MGRVAGLTAGGDSSSAEPPSASAQGLPPALRSAGASH